MDINPVVLFNYLVDDLHGLVDFDAHGLPVLYDVDADVDRVRAYNLVCSIFKKFEDDTTGLEDDALSKFLTTNLRLAYLKIMPNTSLDETLLGGFRDSFREFFRKAIDDDTCWWSWLEIHLQSRPGPGSAIKALACDLYHKLFASPLTYTDSSIHEKYQWFCSFDPRWKTAEFSRHLALGEEQVQGSRLNFVPKNTTSLRTTCVEPNLNMFYQLGLGALVEKCLIKYFGIDLTSQAELNKHLAQRGSLQGDLATLDLSEASDSVSTVLCDWLGIRDVFYELRSPFTFYKGKRIPLNMISSMGNGYTFPLETLIFCCMVKSVYKSYRRYFPRANSKRAKEPWGVFGDDIILPTYMVGRMRRLLELTGFLVNEEKSYTDGPYRESCGGDFYHGLPVRGVFIKSLKGWAHRFSAINRLVRWSIINDIHLDKTLKYLLQSVPKNFVPLHESDDSGIQMPLSWLRSVNRRSLIASDHNGSILYRAWKPRVKKFWIKPERLTISGGKVKHFFNIEGTGLAFLAGCISSCSISTRQRRNAGYTYEKCVTPNWDNVPLAVRSARGWGKLRPEADYWSYLMIMTE